MKAVLVTQYQDPPRYLEVKPTVAQPDSILVKVSRVAISQLARLQASGKHYVRHIPPFVAGVDGVGHLEDGTKVYFLSAHSPVGAMAEYVNVAPELLITLPTELDLHLAAAIANPGMSSWAALTERTQLAQGETVLINGATGASGRLAIQIAKHLGATHIIATGRSEKHRHDLLALGADEYLVMDEPLTDFSQQLQRVFKQGVDVVLDYLWGEPAACVLSQAKYAQQDDAARRIRFINVGSLAGVELNLSANAIRSSGVELMGAGFGSLSNAALVRAIRNLLHSVAALDLKIDYQAHAAADVEHIWNINSPSRIVLTFDNKESLTSPAPE